MKIKLFNILDIFKKKKPNDNNFKQVLEELENIDPYISKNVISIKKYKLKKVVQNG